MRSYDVIVLGLGGMGSAAASHLASRGLKVLGVEQFTSPHDRGSSHGSTRVIRQAYFEHPSYVPLLLRAYELWRELERRSGERLLELPGGLMMGPRQSQVVQGSLASAVEHGLKHEFLDAREIRKKYPLFSVSDDTVALFEPTAGLVWCERSVAAHLKVASRSGADLHFEEQVVQWKIAGSTNAVEVETLKGRYAAGQLVITPGAWAPQVLAGLGLPLQVTRQILFWFQPRCDIPQFALDRFPIYIWQRSEGEQIYGFPSVDGANGGVKVAYFHKPRREVVLPDSVERSVPDMGVDECELRSRLREFLPALDGTRIRATVCMYTTTPDHHFVITRASPAAPVWVACGFSGHGYKFCSVVGEILADLVQSGTTRHELGLFNPCRFGSRETSVP